MKNKKAKHPVIHLYSYVGTPELVFFIALIFLLITPVISIDKFSLISNVIDSFYIGSVYYLAKSHNTKYIKSIGFFIIALLIQTWITFFGYHLHNAIDFILPVILIIISFLFVIKSITKNNEVDIDTVLSAISGYILIGLLFGIIVFTMEMLSPGNFTNVVGLSYYDSIYFSFVTMSTLGYGDISPITQEGKSLVIITTLVGQFYMVIIMGIIVGKFISIKNIKSA